MRERRGTARPACLSLVLLCTLCACETVVLLLSEEQGEGEGWRGHSGRAAGHAVESCSWSREGGQYGEGGVGGRSVRECPGESPRMKWGGAR